MKPPKKLQKQKLGKQKGKRSNGKQVANPLQGISSKIDAEIKDLEARIILECTTAGQSSTKATQFDTPPSEDASNEPLLTHKLFSDLPLSSRTVRGLKTGGFVLLTHIQGLAIPCALTGRDILGEAETGSGKTLAFTIPLLENLYRLKWDRMCGLGGLVISPTRELAAQIFEVFRQAGKYHDLSAGCLIGGKNIKHETEHLNVMNIIVATPGRLLQHLDESPGFDTSNLQMLIVDEADQLVDMGFADTMSQILKQLPPASSRQTLLFSATLGSSVRRLALISLKSEPELISVRHLTPNQQPVPKRLKQTYISVALHEQLNFLFSFLRCHCQRRTIVFVNSCKQVRFLYETLKRLKPGSAVFELHGRQHQQKRLDVVEGFSNKVRAATLICTDIAARGIDFPSVDWVVQMNCPQDVDTYIHRVGRTARYHSAGKAVLFILPSEQKFLQRLKEKNIEPTLLQVNLKKLLSVTSKISSIIASDSDIQHLGKRAMASYIRSVALSKDKEVFEVREMLKLGDNFESEIAEKYSQSLGLAGAPDLPSILEDLLDEKAGVVKKKKISKLQLLKQKIKEKRATAQAEEKEWAPSEEELEQKKSKKERRIEKLRDLRISNKSAAADGNDSDDLSDVLQVVGKLDLNGPDTPFINLDSKDAKKKLAKQQIKFRADGSAKVKGLASLKNENRQVFFSDDEDGATKVKTPLEELVSELNAAPASSESEGEEDEQQRHLRKLKKRLDENRQADKDRDRQRIHERHVKRRERDRKERQESHQPGTAGVAVLALPDEEQPRKKQTTSINSNSIEDLEKAALQVLSF